jgi:hypothetical protein
MKHAFAGIVGEAGNQHPYSFLEILVNAARRDEGVRSEMCEIYGHTRSNIKGVLLQGQKAGEIRDDIDCEALAFEITALMEGTLLMSVIDQSVDLVVIGERMYRSIWSMIKA